MTLPPRVFLSYARSDGEAFAAALRTRLQAEGIPLWRDREGMEGGRDWWQQITAAIDRVDFLVLVMTPAAVSSPLVRREWRYARQRGVAVYPVQADAPIDFEALPRWMRTAHFYDLAHEWRKFAADLNQRPTTMRVPFMVEDLPPDFVPRPREYAQLLDQLLDREHEEPIAITTALRGAGGFGKTALARALCHDEAIQNAFDDGILWVTLGEQPGDLTGHVEDLIHLLSGQRPGFASLQTAVAALAELLADNDILIVIDDAWDAAHVWPFLQGGERCARVITTRNIDVLPAQARRVNVDAMATGEAATLLAHGLPAAAPVAMAALAKLLGEWPLLLKLVNGALRERVVHQGQPLADALAHVGRALDRRGLTFFDPRDATARNAAVASTLGLSLAHIAEAERARFDELAVFPEDAEIPLSTLGALWAASGGLDEFDTEVLCERLARMSLLLSFDLSTRFVRVHDVVRRFLLERLGTDAARLHLTLLACGCPADGWPALAANDTYWWQHLFFHLKAAGRHDDMLATALDLRYLSGKTALRTASGAEADLRQAMVVQPQAALLDPLWQAFRQSAHLFGDCRGAAEVRATLIARLPPRSPLHALAAGLCEPRLVATARLPDLPHPALVRTLGSRRGSMRSCALSRDGRVLATASSDRQVTLWDTTTGTELRHLAPASDDSAAARSVNSVAMSADGGRVAATTGDRRAWVWDAASGALLASLQGHTDDVNACALSADGSRLVTAANDETLKVWTLPDGVLRHTLGRGRVDDALGGRVPGAGEGHWAAVLACAVSADGRRAASASADERVIVWDLDSGAALQVLTGHGAAATGCAFSPDGLRLASVGADHTLRLWELADGQQRAVTAHARGVTACAFAEDGQTLVTASADATVRIWAADTLELLQTLVGHAGWVFGCALSATAGLAASAGGDGTARLWRLGVRADPYRPRQHAGAVQGCTATPDGRHAFTGGEDGTLMLWDVKRGQSRRHWQAHEAAVLHCAASNDGLLLATASADRSVGVWDVADARRIAGLVGHRAEVNACAFDPTGPRLASVSSDRSARLWDLQTRSRRLAWRAHAQPVTACAYSPDGRWFVTGAADGALTRWTMDFDDALWEAWLTDARPLSGERLAALAPLALGGHGAAVTGIVFSPDRQRVLTASADRTLKVWQASTGALLHTVDGHLEGVNGCDIDAAGQRVVSVSDDGGVRVWRLADGHCELALHVDGALSACAWVGRGGLLVATGARGVYLLACAE